VSRSATEKGGHENRGEPSFSPDSTGFFPSFLSVEFRSVLIGVDYDAVAFELR